MPFYDSTAQDNALDALWGDNRGPLRPALFDLGLLTSDPRATGTVDEMPDDGSEAATHWAIFVGGDLHDFGKLDGELTFEGYARIIGIGNDDTFWQAADGGAKDSTPQTFPGADEPVTVTVRFNVQAA